MRNILRSFDRDEGAEIAEAAVVLPLVFMFLLGIVWFGRAFNIYSTITQAAQRGAVTAARPICATCGNTFPAAGTVETAVFSVMDASSIDKSQIITYIPAAPQCPTPPPPIPAPPSGCVTNPSSNITVCQFMQLNPGSAPAQCGMIVSFQYPFKFYLPFSSLNLQQVMLRAEAHSRMED